MTAANVSHAGSAGARNPLMTIAASPVLFGTLLTVLFYLAIPSLPLERAFVERYFCSHWIEYVTTGLFFIGMTILAQKALRLPSESRALAQDPLARISEPGANVTATLSKIHEELGHVPRRLRHSYLVERIVDVSLWLRNRPNADGVEDYLKYRAEVGLERLHEGYSLVRTVTWAIPILGFLGTVIGITMAIANLNPEQLANSLETVTGGLAVAFDTTALSLSLSLVIVFTAFLVERAEQRILGRVEEFALRRLAPLFPEARKAEPPAPMSRLIEAESRAAERLLEQTESLILQQTQLWEESLNEMRERWQQTLERQSAALEQSLQAGLSATLSSHEEQLALARDEFLVAFEKATNTLQGGLSAAFAEQQAAHESLNTQLALSTERSVEGLTVLQTRQAEQVDRLISEMDQRIDRWLQQMPADTETGRALAEEILRQADILA